jgi:uncharacterized glyoxalase superfamily protein PhnB
MRSLFAQLILDVHNVENSMNFYTDLLGFTVDELTELDGHRIAHLSANGFEILLLEQPITDQLIPLRRGSGLIMNFRVVGLREVADTFKNKEINILRGLEEEPFGDRTLLIEDPDGKPILLSESVGTVH